MSLPKSSRLEVMLLSAVTESPMLPMWVRIPTEDVSDMALVVFVFTFIVFVFTVIVFVFNVLVFVTFAVFIILAVVLVF